MSSSSSSCAVVDLPGQHCVCLCVVCRFCQRAPTNTSTRTLSPERRLEFLTSTHETQKNYRPPSSGTQRKTSSTTSTTSSLSSSERIYFRTSCRERKTHKVRLGTSGAARSVGVGKVLCSPKCVCVCWRKRGRKKGVRCAHSTHRPIIPS